MYSTYSPSADRDEAILFTQHPSHSARFCLCLLISELRLLYPSFRSLFFRNNSSHIDFNHFCLNPVTVNWIESKELNKHSLHVWWECHVLLGAQNLLIINNLFQKESCVHAIKRQMSSRPTLNIRVRGRMGEYLNTTGLKTSFTQSGLEEEQHHHPTGTSGYRKAKTRRLWLDFKKPQEMLRPSGIIHIWQNNLQAGMGQKEVQYYSTEWNFWRTLRIVCGKKSHLNLWTKVDKWNDHYIHWDLKFMGWQLESYQTSGFNQRLLWNWNFPPNDLNWKQSGGRWKERGLSVFLRQKTFVRWIKARQRNHQLLNISRVNMEIV